MAFLTNEDIEKRKAAGVKMNKDKRKGTEKEQ